MKWITSLTLNLFLCLMFVANVYAYDSTTLAPSNTDAENEITPALPPLPEKIAKLFEDVAVKLDTTCANMAMLNDLPYIKLVGITKTGTVFVATVMTMMRIGDNCSFEPPSQENILEIIWLVPGATEPELWVNEPLVIKIIKQLIEGGRPDSEVPSKKINI